MVVLSPKVLKDIRLTVDEYLQADFPEGHRYELIDGVVEMTPTPDGLHDEVLGALEDALHEYRQKHPEIRHRGLGASVPIPDSKSVREPDLALYREWQSGLRGWSIWKRFKPFWVAEVVSPLGESRDYDEKRRDYWTAGIEEYWIIDPQASRITVLTRGPVAWAESVYDRTATARSTALPGFAVPAARLLPVLE